MDIPQLIESIEFRFKGAGVDNAKRVAEEMLAHAFDCQTLAIYTETIQLPTNMKDQFELIRKIEAMAERIENGEPLQYVVGHVDFWGLKLKSDSRALIPRPETEILVEEVLSSSIWNRKPVALADIGTGSGCIILTIATQRPSGHYSAVDLSEAALTLAKENAKTLGLTDRVQFKHGSLLDQFGPKSLDAIVANLPYISTPVWEGLAPVVRKHEPRTALNSGPTGMELIEQLVKQARSVLHPGGMIFLEIGYDQGQDTKVCLAKNGFKNVQIKHDLSNLDRIAIAENP